MDVRQKQKYGIEFLNAEEVQPIEIHKRLVNVHGNETVDVSTVRRWVLRFQSGDTDVIDKLRSGRPSTATNEESKARLDKFIKSNRRMIVNEMSTELGVSMSAVEKLILSLGYTTGVPEGCHKCSLWNKKTTR